MANMVIMVFDDVPLNQANLIGKVCNDIFTKDEKDFITIFLLRLVLVLPCFFGLIIGVMVVPSEISFLLFMYFLLDAANVAYYCSQVFGT